VIHGIVAMFDYLGLFSWMYFWTLFLHQSNLYFWALRFSAVFSPRGFLSAVFYPARYEAFVSDLFSRCRRGIVKSTTLVVVIVLTTATKVSSRWTGENAFSESVIKNRLHSRLVDKSRWFHIRLAIKLPQPIPENQFLRTVVQKTSGLV